MTQDERLDFLLRCLLAELEKVVNLSPSEISDFPNHPFKVRMDAAMQEMTDSVKQYGVLVPALVRPKPEGGYERVFTNTSPNQPAVNIFQKATEK